MAKLSMKEKYHALTRDLDWTPTYVDPKDVYPYTRYEGIKIHDWDAWEDPFRLTVDSYCKYQAEKDKKLYAVIDSFSQGQGHLSLSDARYLNSMKLFLQGVTPIEYAANRHFAYLARQLDGPGPRFAALCQSIDELRHTQIEIHTLGLYNKHYDGFHNWQQMWDRLWYLTVPKSFIEDAMSAGPFEYLTATSFSFEYLLTNLLFVPFMSGASFNGDLASMTFGFSAQSDESRHMTLGLESIKFMLEQDEDNVPIIQDWIDKWFWRGYRLLGLVAGMLDYMLPKKVMSWKDAFELYFEQQMLDGLFPDLELYGIRAPRHVDVAIAEKDRVSHQIYWMMYSYSFGTAFHTTIPDERHLRWLSDQYPDSFDRYYRPLWDKAKTIQDGGERFFYMGLPQLCQVCQIPVTFTEPSDPTRISHRSSLYEGERYNLCSDGCQWIFEREPEKYRQAWLPIHQIYQGNCGGTDLSDVIAWCGVRPGDAGEYLISPDHDNWQQWHADEELGTQVGG